MTNLLEGLYHTVQVRQPSPFIYYLYYNESSDSFPGHFPKYTRCFSVIFQRDLCLCARRSVPGLERLGKHSRVFGSFCTLRNL